MLGVACVDKQPNAAVDEPRRYDSARLITNAPPSRTIPRPFLQGVDHVLGELAQAKSQELAQAHKPSPRAPR